MVKWPFRRKQTEDDVPQEIQEYYQSEKRERVGVAWMLALGTLVVTVLLALGIFYGGRWAYRALFDDNGETAPAGQEERLDQNEAGREDEGGMDEPVVLPGDDDETDDDGSSEEEVPSQTPSTGPTLPETGPSENL